jgi:hypothetical protein
MNDRVEVGFGETGEMRGEPAQIKIGPIRLGWSIGGEGAGWVYFGPNVRPSLGYELALTHEIDITRLDTSGLEFLTPAIPL